MATSQAQPALPAPRVPETYEYKLVPTRATLTSGTNYGKFLKPTPTNVVLSWLGPQMVWSNAVARQAGAIISHYVLHWGKDRNSITNSLNVGLALSLVPYTIPAGTNLVQVSAVDSNGLESDRTPPLVADVFHEWALFTALPLKFWKFTTNYNERITIRKDSMEFFKVFGTNRTTRTGTDWVGVKVEAQ